MALVGLYGWLMANTCAAAAAKSFLLLHFSAPVFSRFCSLNNNTFRNLKIHQQPFRLAAAAATRPNWATRMSIFNFNFNLVVHEKNIIILCVCVPQENRKKQKKGNKIPSHALGSLELERAS